MRDRKVSPPHPNDLYLIRSEVENKQFAIELLSWERGARLHGIVSSQAAPEDIRFKGSVPSLHDVSLLDFWRWAFSDLCDDDIKGIFAEWMVSNLLGVPSSRRVSWADCDLFYRNTRVEVKATAIWQSWKLIEPDGSLKNPFPASGAVNELTTRFRGLRARTAEQASTRSELRQFKSDMYVFCLHNETNPRAWDAWDLNQWEFYAMTRQELAEAKIGTSISLATLRRTRSPMSAAQFKSYMEALIPIRTLQESK